MEQTEKNKINCLKFVLENKISKEGKTEFELAQDLFNWTSSTDYSINRKNPEEQFEILPEEGSFGYPAADLENPSVRAVLKKINRDPKRMKELANVERNSKNFQNTPDVQ